MRFVDPQAKPMQAAEPYTLSTPLREAPVIGLMANGFPGSVAFLSHIETAIASQVAGSTFVHWNKGNASRLATADELAALAAECDAVIGAYGH